MSHDDLAGSLRKIKAESGRSLRAVEQAIHVSNSSLSRYLAGQATPSWNVVVAFCRFTGHDPRPLRPLWEAAERERRAPGRPFAADRPAAASRVPRNDLPRDVAGFTARRAEVETVSRLARAGQAVAIDGMGGVGKTALAVKVAHLLTPEFPDCQLYVDLHGFTPGRDPVEPTEALLGLLRALGVPGGRIPDDLAGRSAQWRSELARQRAIVILDNAADADHVRALLPGAGRNTVLITSRVRMVGLDGVQPLSLAPLGPADAADLFTVALGPGTAADPETVAELMRRYGGLPLSIRVAAARLRHRPAWSVADLLESPPPSDEAGLGKVIDASLARLGGDQRQMFLLLGLYPGTLIGPFAAAALAGRPVTEARALLDDLVDANLLEEPAAQRYRFHDLIRQRAAEAARREESAEGRDTALDRLTDFYLHTVTCGVRALDVVPEHVLPVRHVPAEVPDISTPEQAMSWYRDEEATLVRVVEQTVRRGRDDLTAQFALLIGDLLGRYGRWELWRWIADIGVQAAERLGNLSIQAALEYSRGLAAYFTGRLDSAAADFAAAADIAARSGAVGMRIIAIRGVAAVAEDRGEFTRALDLLAEARQLPLADRYPTEVAIAAVLTAHHSLLALGRVAEAADVARDVLATAQDPTPRITSLRVLGRARLSDGDLPGAVTYFQEAEAACRDNQDASFAAICQGDVAEALSRLGRHAEALDRHEAALAWATDFGDVYREIYLREAFARSCLAAGDPDRAVDQFRQALALAEPRGYRHVAGLARDGLARALAPVG
ncbi:transcriptional regulator, XRE family [Catenulispora acidiphila DSM 44928]|uniref:Transcriptional regulator, XRE family n=1 Tax=Catenulispora acidiphila (strain DSM 44928 / JCM 14897 / NBRC 102108 / NRRL B-24433 / ID139908) TaxID=479433 RepID=C7Q118_CATAD|nr:tetratricopeptide repeat protein [Catenulispora acidiphila]ACU71693.1 transcriptional regulator, XRE family [Catenulispora acidiphila DSM 44928]